MLRLMQRLAASERSMRALAALSPSLRLWHPDVRRDPYPTHRALRERGLTRLRLFGGWLVGRYDDVVRVLREPAFTTNREQALMMRLLERSTRGAPEFRELIENNLLMIDGAKHRRLRGLVAKAFTPRRAEALRPRAEAVVQELLDRMASRDDPDLVRDLAAPLPAVVIAELLGVPAADRERFGAWSDGLAELLDPLSGRDGLDPPMRAAAALSGYFRELLALRRRAPRDDLVSAMLAAEQDGDALSETELAGLASLLLAAGHETTTNLIGNAVLLLLRHPDERKRLQDDPALLPSAVEECLRFEPPVQLTDRVVAEPVELGGQRLVPGQIVGTLLAAANRDPAHFPDPDRFDVGRERNRHLSFGLGAHHCIGAPLARIEAQAALGGLLRRFPDFSGSPAPPAWKRSVVLRGPTSLPLRLR